MLSYATDSEDKLKGFKTKITVLNEKNEVIQEK